MNRIKFRMWCVCDHYSKLVYFTLDKCLDEMDATGGGSTSCREAVMQYTGMNDIEGDEIYEGDIVKDTTYYEDLWPIEGVQNANYIFVKYEVYWCHKNAQFRMKNDQYDEKLNPNLQVVGNIYEY